MASGSTEALRSFAAKRRRWERTVGCLLLAVLLLSFLPAAKAAGEPPAPAAVELVVATDLHCISPEICDFGPAFVRLMDSADGKLTRYCEELTDAFLAEVIARGPQALLLTGDLSFNGAAESHRALAGKLARVEEAGIPVLVLTGNHDVYNTNAARFYGDSAGRLPPCTSEDFREIYAAFGFDEALSEDPDSLSYVYALDAETRVLMLDFNTAHDFCGISRASLAWAEEQLRRAAAEGARVLAAGHQNLFAHSVFVQGYVIDRAQELAALLRRYEVPLFLSGHLHIQHVRSEEGLTEIAGSALSVAPCQYGLLRWEPDRIAYETRRTDVAAWAAAMGREEKELLSFAAYADGVMDARTARDAAAELAALGFDAQERARMIAYACLLNRAYFAGDLRDWERWDPDGSAAALWARSGTLRDYYMRSVVPDFGADYTRWEWEKTEKTG